MSQVLLVGSVQWVQSGSHCVPSQWEAAACLAMQESGAKQALCSLLESHTHKHLPHITWNMTLRHWDAHICVFVCVLEHVHNRWERGERRWMCLNVSLIISSITYYTRLSMSFSLWSVLGGRQASKLITHCILPLGSLWSNWCRKGFCLKLTCPPLLTQNNPLTSAYHHNIHTTSRGTCSYIFVGALKEVLVQFVLC